tara:strand:- start:212 stop:565 length:354 start_codon:yes stop_codon:yes gene_type:complete
MSKSNKGKNRNYSISSVLRKKNKITDEFEIMLSTLSIEDIIALKLELSVKAVGGKLYGIPIWASMTDITKEAVLKFALSATKTKLEAGRFLGLTEMALNTALNKYKVEKYFEDPDSQ